MSDSEGNSWSSEFVFPRVQTPDVSRDEVEGNIRTRGKTKLTGFPRDPTLSVSTYFNSNKRIHLSGTNEDSRLSTY